MAGTAAAAAAAGAVGAVGQNVALEEEGGKEWEMLPQGESGGSEGARPPETSAEVDAVQAREQEEQEQETACGDGGAASQAARGDNEGDNEQRAYL